MLQGGTASGQAKGPGQQAGRTLEPETAQRPRGEAQGPGPKGTQKPQPRGRSRAAPGGAAEGHSQTAMTEEEGEEHSRARRPEGHLGRGQTAPRKARESDVCTPGGPTREGSREAKQEQSKGCWRSEPQHLLSEFGNDI